MRRLLATLLVCLVALCAQAGTAPAATTSSYFDNTGRDDVLSGGVKTIVIDTPKGKFKVWTKRVGNNPRIKVLLLHGGPGATHEYFEAFDSYFPGEGIEYYYYDQLGSAFSDNPKDESLWEIPRFVDEVEQVRTALHLDKDNFYLLGHSWGGVLAIEYALKYPQHLKGLVISNMMDSIPAYNAYASKVLMPAMDQKKLAEVKRLEAEHKTDDPAYMALLMPMHYEQHILRMPAAQWPDPVERAFSRLNQQIYVAMQGPSELGASGKLLHWDRSQALKTIKVPTLVIGARYDTMDPAYMEAMAKKMPDARFLLCPQGSHMAMYDDQKTYFAGLVKFLKDVDAGKPLN
ncbi:proline iminopeptidase [Luteibacter jiangsuensis]|uniref:Proline iminopeptidase n=1 Tax=Luteibacter jiangsuensis TaxID=637577 RepID=A0ABT9T267_9GAMM|nr:proline iminopeptidase-family hydrolase [Luteibacter jiangsuensis]MDQ0011369.1 proline iminopeptidase [Luteibacter jiangsuensis]